MLHRGTVAPNGTPSLRLTVVLTSSNGMSPENDHLRFGNRLRSTTAPGTLRYRGAVVPPSRATPLGFQAEGWRGVLFGFCEPVYLSIR